MDPSDALDELLSRADKVAADLARDVLRPLSEYDQTHSGDLVRTLDTYLALNGNASRAAEALFLHRSGLLYRLGRIEALLAVRLDDPAVRLALSLALRTRE